MTETDSLGTPTLDNAGKVNLLRIVRNEGAEFEDDATEVSVGAAKDLRGGHPGAQRRQDVCYCMMIELLLEGAEFIAISDITFTCAPAIS